MVPLRNIKNDATFLVMDFKGILCAILIVAPVAATELAVAQNTPDTSKSNDSAQATTTSEKDQKKTKKSHKGSKGSKNDDHRRASDDRRDADRGRRKATEKLEVDPD
jgi:hypothetical protein